jgi:hypothetical protein
LAWYLTFIIFGAAAGALVIYHGGSAAENQRATAMVDCMPADIHRCLTLIFPLGRSSSRRGRARGFVLFGNGMEQLGAKLLLWPSSPSSVDELADIRALVAARTRSGFAAAYGCAAASFSYLFRRTTRRLFSAVQYPIRHAQKNCRRQLEDEYTRSRSPPISSRGCCLRSVIRRSRNGDRSALHRVAKVTEALGTAQNIKVGAQNMHWERSGAFTGEISPAMLRDLYKPLRVLGTANDACCWRNRFHCE